MSATHDSHSACTFTVAASVAWAHTLAGGSNLVLAVYAGQSAGTLQPVTTVTYGAQSLARIASSKFTTTNTSAEWWKLPDGTPPSGNQTITVTLTDTNTAELSCGAIVAKDASQTTPVFGTPAGANDTSGASPSISQTVPSGTDELSVCAFSQTIGNRGITTTSGTEAWNMGTGGQGQGSGSYITGSASAVHTWTSADVSTWSVCGVSIKAKPAPPSPPKSKNRTTLMRSGIATFPAELDVKTWYRSLVDCLRMVFA